MYSSNWIELKKEFVKKIKELPADDEWVIKW
jgi:hypothetical protein